MHPDWSSPKQNRIEELEAEVDATHEENEKLTKIIEHVKFLFAQGRPDLAEWFINYATEE